MKAQKVIRDPGAFQLLADDTRLKMVYLLRAKEMTVSQMAGDLELTPQTVYHHIKKLKAAEMIEVSREERIDHLVESYYRATAGIFYFVDGGCGDEWKASEVVRKALKALDGLDHKIDMESNGIDRIIQLREQLRRDRENPKITEKVYEMDDVDPFTQNIVIEFAMMMNMNDEEFEKHLNAQRIMREWLLKQEIKSA